jgi:hypothetical protein
VVDANEDTGRKIKFMFSHPSLVLLHENIKKQKYQDLKCSPFAELLSDLDESHEMLQRVL